MQFGVAWLVTTVMALYPESTAKPGAPEAASASSMLDQANSPGMQRQINLPTMPTLPGIAGVNYQQLFTDGISLSLS